MNHSCPLQNVIIFSAEPIKSNSNNLELKTRQMEYLRLLHSRFCKIIMRKKKVIALKSFKIELHTFMKSKIRIAFKFVVIIIHHLAVFLMSLLWREGFFFFFFFFFWFFFFFFFFFFGLFFNVTSFGEFYFSILFSVGFTYPFTI